MYTPHTPPTHTLHPPPYITYHIQHIPPHIPHTPQHTHTPHITYTHLKHPQHTPYTPHTIYNAPHTAHTSPHLHKHHMHVHTHVCICREHTSPPLPHRTPPNSGAGQGSACTTGHSQVTQFGSHGCASKPPGLSATYRLLCCTIWQFCSEKGTPEAALRRGRGLEGLGCPLEVLARPSRQLGVVNTSCSFATPPFYIFTIPPFTHTHTH